MVWWKKLLSMFLQDALETGTGAVKEKLTPKKKSAVGKSVKKRT